jgi:hypothetical protein
MKVISLSEGVRDQSDVEAQVTGENGTRGFTILKPALRLILLRFLN